jgi:hypothetical protein
MTGGSAPLFNHVAEHLHHALRLLFCEALILQPLYKLECVEMMVLELRRRGTELATRLEGRWVPGDVL